ncbi:hypothetical protein FNW52_08940 [Flavobacterium sp. ZT3R18]|uniref:hypothetical protein n=1 Tax=Flavobacterium sp. ZT3R18 TaxID=2594429 RepID=UPI00117B17E6|nr:hypothetical protein [Flavobacterium sp. ZT3R18]TRX36141.1 hypothetical protein FNW52_08940 [Flavobacterium sp. ZT3R18]
MRKITFIITFFILLTSCSLKQTKNNLASGNYDAAIDIAVSNLRSNKDKKGKQDYIYLLEEAFAKAKERDLNTLSFLSKDNHPSNLEKIYNTYLALNDRQEKIKPLLPLKLIKEGRSAIFPFDNYTDGIISSKNNLSNYLYTNAKALMLTKNKMNYRRVYDDLVYLDKINPNYKDVAKIMDEAQFKGTDFVIVSAQNETNMIIPVQLQNDLLDFKSYQLNDKWTVYHSIKQKGTNYDFGMLINFRSIFISPEQIKEREFIKERQVVDGQRKQLDANGRVVLDRYGKPVMIDNLVNATINIYEIRQFKSCQITAKVDYIDNKTNQSIESFPIASEFVFENIYSTYKGDRRAADANYYTYFDKRVVPFPTSEQMVYDTGEDLKAKINAVITRNQFRK